MAAFVHGGGDLGSSTLENAFLEVVARAGIFERALATPTANLNDDLSANGTTIAVTAVIPVTTTLVGGKMTLTAVDFVSEVFDPGTGGTLVSTTYPAAILETAQKMQALEEAQDKAVLNMAYNADAGTVTVTGTFGTTRTVETDGSQKIVITPYLT